MLVTDFLCDTDQVLHGSIIWELEQSMAGKGNCICAFGGEIKDIMLCNTLGFTLCITLHRILGQ